MSGSALTPFNFIPENSLATPGLWNSVFSTLSQNIAEANTLSVLSGGLSLGTQGLTINVPSNVTDYIFLNDSANLRSSYVIGSFNSGTADGLNIWDASGQTMIVSFSKQSVRFFQQVVGPVFDVGGALASTLNAATFGGSLVTTQIQAAISAATNAIPKIKRVYVPASMYPYKSDKMAFETSVQMVREGGNWAVYDVFAYGALGLGTDAASIQAAVNGAAANGGTVYFPAGTYNVGTSITANAAQNLQITGAGSNAALIAMAASGVTLLNFTGVCSGLIIRDLWLGSFVSYAAGGSLSIVGTTATHSDTVLVEAVTVQNTPYPITLECVDRATLRTIHAQSSITSAVVGPVLSLRTVISTVVDDFDALASSGSYPTDVVDISHDCDTLFFINSQALHGTGNGFRIRNAAGATGPRLVRFTNCLAESNTSAGFSVEAGRDVRLAQCESSLNSTGYVVSGGTSVTITDGLAYQNNGHGFVVLPGAADVRIEGCGATNNSQSASVSFDGILVESNVTTGVILANNRSGDFILPSTPNKQRFGLSLGTSTDSLVVVGNDLRLNTTAAFRNYSTGVSNFILDPSNLTTSSGGTLTALSGAIVRNTLLVGGDIANGGEILRCNSHGRFAGYVIVTGANGSVRFDNRTSSGSSILNIYNQVGTELRFGNASNSNEFMYLGGTVFSAISLTPVSSGSADLGSANRPWGKVVTQGLAVKNGTNASFGTATLGSNGSVNVATTYVAAGDVIFLTDQTAGGTLGDIEVGGIRAGSGFTIQSTSITDTSTVGWLIVRPT